MGDGNVPMETIPIKGPSQIKTKAFIAPGDSQLKTNISAQIRQLLRRFIGLTPGREDFSLETMAFEESTRQTYFLTDRQELK